MGCDFTVLSAYLDGEVTKKERQTVAAHLATCDDCRRELERLERTRMMVNTLVEKASFHQQVIRRVEAAERARGAQPRQFGWLRGAFTVTAIVIVLGALFLTAWSRWQKPATDAHIARLPAVAAPTAEKLLAAAEQPSPPKPELAAVAPPETPASEPAEKTSAAAAVELPLMLTGTMGGAVPVATFTMTTTGEHKSCEMGEEVLPGVTVAAIEPRRVTLNCNGQEQVLTLGHGPAVSAPSLAGKWTARVTVNDKVIEEKFPVTVSQEGSSISVVEASGDLLGKGELTGNYLAVSGTHQEKVNGQDVVAVSVVAQGTVNADATAIHLEGKVSSPAPDASGNAICDLLRVLGNVPSAEETRMLMKRREEQVRQMFSYLNRYASDHEGQFPPALKDLIPDYVPSLGPFENADGRQVQYFPGQTSSRFDAGAASLPLNSFRPDLDMPDRLAAYEQACIQARGGSLLSKVHAVRVLNVKYKDPDAEFDVTPNGMIYSKTSANDAETARIQCANNLKQLGLVLKMFSNECPGEYMPAGWMSTFPEFLAELSILSCPADASGAVYEIVFPATNPEMLQPIYEAVKGLAPGWDAENPAGSAMMQSEIPFVIENHPHTCENGKVVRNVLFLDGHVESMSDSAWQERVEPYLKYRK